MAGKGKQHKYEADTRKHRRTGSHDKVMDSAGERDVLVDPASRLVSVALLNQMEVAVSHNGQLPPGGEPHTHRQTEILTPESTGGFGTQPAKPLLTLPPIQPSLGDYPLSKRTGEPKRSWLALLIIGLLATAATIAFVFYWNYWWHAIHIVTFQESAMLIGFFEPRPGSALSVVLVCIMAILGVAMSFIPGAAAYYVWRGMIRPLSLTLCALVGLLAIFFFPLMWISSALGALAAILIWLPQMRPYLAAWQEFNDPPRRPIVPSAVVEYGPAPRFR